ncbi:MAG: tyrosine--tRNA ligase, partial [Firmicutes bacterium]|nr:tyrosine--tRNA ligase [Bacillota bacterium]
WRLIAQGGVSADGERVQDEQAVLALRDGMVLKVGKRKFARVRLP